MYFFKTTEGLQRHINQNKSSNQKIGFVPTMGALHQGHLSLIQQSQSVCSHTICSVFVNPTQFNESSDLQKYPRTPAKDVELLTMVGTDILFMPQVSEVYPNGTANNLAIDFQGLDQVMEGKFRPGHFEGVAQVVHRLLELTKPDVLFMGQKDFQQCAIVGRMIEALSLDIELYVCPIVRDDSGLALSSRNVRLSPQGKEQALILSKSLQEAKVTLEKESVQSIVDTVKTQFSESTAELEYFEIVDGRSLQPVADEKDTDFIVACVAAWVDGVRLIDNMILKGGF